MGACKGLRPLLSVHPSLASTPTLRSLQGLAVLEAPDHAAVVFVADPPGGDADLWGELPSVASLACGTYLPLVRESSGSFDVELHMPGVKLLGSSMHPIRVQVEDSAASTPGVVFLLAYMPVTVHGDEDGTSVYDRFCVFNTNGISVMETSCLDGGPWLAKTSVAEETDLRLRSGVGALRPRPPGAPSVAPAPPGPPPEVLRCLEVWIVALEGAREGNVERLEAAVRRACGLLAPEVPVKRFKAWDTRGLSSGTVRALCHEAVLDRKIFSQESVVLRKGGGSQETYTEATHKRASKVLGCALSHSDVWYQLAAGRSEGPWLILEDDAVLNESRPIAAVLKSALSTFVEGSWDILLLGAASQQDGQWDYLSPCTMGPVEEFIGFWGYVISKQGAQRALSWIWGSPEERQGLRGDIDVECARAAKRGRLRVLACMPHLVLHPHCGLDPSLAQCQSAWRHLCRPARYQYRTIQVGADAEFDSTRAGGASGDGAMDMRLARRAAARAADFRRAAPGAGGPGAPAAGAEEEEWRVVHARVARRAEPSTSAQALGMALRGARVRGVARDVQGVQWLELREDSDGHPQSAWMLIHGQSVGLGQLLERVSAPGESAA